MTRLYRETIGRTAMIMAATCGSAAVVALSVMLFPAAALTASAIAAALVGLASASVAVAVSVRRTRKLVATLRSAAEAAALEEHGSESPSDEVLRSIRALRLRIEEGATFRSALEGSVTMVMLSDESGRIAYVNPPLRRLFVDHAEQVRDRFPDLDPMDPVGASFDALHREILHDLDRQVYTGVERRRLRAEEDASPSQERRSGLLDRLGDGVEGQVHVGGRQLRVAVTPVRAEDGSVRGAFAQWIDRTDEAAIETEIDNVVDMIGMGELDIEISVEKSDNRIAAGINRLVEIVRDSLAGINDVLSALANGDLTRRIEGDYWGRFGELKDNANASVDQIATTVGRIHSAAGAMQAMVERMREGVERLSSRSEQASISIVETSAAAESLAGSVVATASRAREADAIAQDARVAADRGGAVARDSTAAMSAIEDATRRVSDIIGVIDDIAFQTNLLALNASVEAARAGEAGRGFAVVATEVRSLAQRAAASASDVKALIAKSDAEVRRGVGLARDAGAALGSIEHGIAQVADLITAISEAGGAQERDVAGVSATLSEMDGMTRDNSQLAQDTAAAIRDLAELSSELAKAISFFGSVDMERAAFSPAEAPSRGAPDAHDAASEEYEWASFADEGAATSSETTSTGAAAAMDLDGFDPSEFSDFDASDLQEDPDWAAVDPTAA